jgi:hypothetical protein
VLLGDGRRTREQRQVGSDEAAVVGDRIHGGK